MPKPLEGGDVRVSICELLRDHENPNFTVNSPKYNTESIRALACCFLLALARSIDATTVVTKIPPIGPVVVSRSVGIRRVNMAALHQHSWGDKSRTIWSRSQQEVGYNRRRKTSTWRCLFRSDNVFSFSLLGAETVGMMREGKDVLQKTTGADLNSPRQA